MDIAQGPQVPSEPIPQTAGTMSVPQDHHIEVTRHRLIQLFFQFLKGILNALPAKIDAIINTEGHWNRIL